MKQFFYITILTTLLITGFAYAGAPVAETVVKPVIEISVKEVQQMLDKKAGNLAVLDANNADARADAGVVPGAILLTSYNQYALTELPKDKNKTLVFYCYNSYCQASHLAAERAIAAGYKDSRVMKEGIVGWNAAKL